MQSSAPMSAAFPAPAVPATQVPSMVVAANMSAAAGLSTISTNVSMSIVHLITLDHNCVRAMYDAYKSPSINLQSKQLLAWEMIMALSSHAAKEEMVLYPVVRSTLGPAVADHLIAEHSAVKTLLSTLDAMSVADPSFDVQLRTSLDSMIRHIEEEETTFLPQLAAVLNADTQLQLGIQFEAAKVRAPTRPHPEAASLPPFNETAFAAAKQVDTALDQARMPSLVPTSVGLSPLVSAALTSAAAGTGTEPAGAAGMEGHLPAGDAGMAGADAGGDLPGMEGVQSTPVHTHEGVEAGAGADDTDMTGGAGTGMMPEDAGMDDTLGAAGGMPGDLTAAGPGGGGAGGDIDVGDVAKRPRPADLAPSGAPDEPLRSPGKGVGT